MSPAPPGRRRVRAVRLCRREGPAGITPVDAPAATAPLALNLAVGGDGRLAVSWLEPRAGGGYTLRMAARDSADWGEPRTVVYGATLATHPTDLPGVAFLPGGALLAHWQEMADWSPMDFETDVRLAVSTDGGSSWSAPERPYPLPTLDEHSFVGRRAHGLDDPPGLQQRGAMRTRISGSSAV